MDSTNGVNTVVLKYFEKNLKNNSEKQVTSYSKLLVSPNQKYNPTQNEFCTGVIVKQKVANVVAPKEEPKKEAEPTLKEQDKKEEVSSEEEKDEECSECADENGVFEFAHVGKTAAIAVAVIALVLAL
jgi:hypothetical protein